MDKLEVELWSDYDTKYVKKKIIFVSLAKLIY